MRPPLLVFPCYRILPSVVHVALLPLFLVSAGPAAAQKLTLNGGTAEIINVTNNGTFSGTLVKSPSYSYSDGASASTYAYQEIDNAGIVAVYPDYGSTVTLDEGSSVTTLNNITTGKANVDITGGSVTTLNNGVNPTTLPAGVNLASVSISAGNITTLNNLGGDYNRFISSGQVNLSGGTTDTVNNNGILDMDGGTVGTLNDKKASGASVFAPGGTSYVDSGTINALNVGSESYTAVFGGKIGTLTVESRQVNDFGAGNAELDGGNVKIVDNSGTINVISSEVGSLFNRNSAVTNITGGAFDFLDNFTGGIINVYGTDLALTNGILTGTLQYGGDLHADYKNDGGTLNLLHPSLPSVPEASTTVSFTTVSFGLLLTLGLGRLKMVRHRKVSFSQKRSPAPA